jgi:hypothetical protein
MTKAEIGAIVPFPERFSPNTEHPIDHLRPDFMHHVMSPVGHTAVVRTIDTVRHEFLSKTEEQKTWLQEFANGARDMSPVNLALRVLGSTLGDIGNTIPVYPTWSHFTNRQLIAADRFFSFASPANGESSDRMLFSSGVTTVKDVIRMIESRHPELEISNPDKMISFLRDPLTPSTLRGFATGGFGFLASLDSNLDSETPQGTPWHKDSHKPILDTSGKHPHASKELRKAALAHRMSVQAISADDTDTLQYYSIFYDGVTNSIGCPVRFTTFRTDIKQLTVNGLQLSQRQLIDMMSGDQPIVKQIDTNGYRIVKDAYETVGTILADALEVVAL